MNHAFKGAGSWMAVLLTVFGILCPAGAHADWVTEGDLVYWDQGFDAEGCIPGYAVGVYLVMWSVPGPVYDEDFAWDFECARASVRADVHAQNQNVTLAAYEVLLWTDPDTGDLFPVDELYLEYALPGAGPGNVNLWMSAFIPNNWVPHPVFLGLIFGGDDRSFNWGGSARLSITGDVLNSATSNGDWLFAPFAGSSGSAMYELDTSLDNLPFLGGRLTQAAKEDFVPGPPMKIEWGTASIQDSRCDAPERLGQSLGHFTSTIRIYCKGSANDPLVWGSPDLDWEYWITLEFGFNEVKYTIDGSHDGYPSYELYLNGTSAYTKETNGDLLSLFSPNEVSVSRSGVVR